MSKEVLEIYGAGFQAFMDGAFEPTDFVPDVHDYADSQLEETWAMFRARKFEKPVEVERDPKLDRNCSDTDPNIFFPLDEGNSAQVAHAKLLCSGCIGQAACLEGALKRHESAGIWGGLTTNERHKLKIEI